jgi:mono/diheme cytochrome c family protein
VRARLAGIACGLLWAGAPGAQAYQPAVNFQLQCMGCHLADGSGQPGRVPSVRRSLVLLSQSAAGRNYVVRVPGVAQAPLSDEEVAQLLNWMLRNLSDLAVPPGTPAYAAGEIAPLRSRPLSQVRALRARLMQAAEAGRRGRR